jgi:hypothetical protein
MKDILQLSFNFQRLQSKFAISTALGPLLWITFMIFQSSAIASPPIRIRGEVIKHSTLVELIPPEAAVFVIARRKDTRMPLAVQRIPNPKFPVKFDLGPEHIMVAGQKLDGEVFLEAKLTHRGDAISKPGDWIMAQPPQKIDLPSSKKFTLNLEKKQSAP